MFQKLQLSVWDHLVFAVDLLSLDSISGVELRASAGQAQQHGPFQVHAQLGVQVLLWRLTHNGCYTQMAVQQFHSWLNSRSGARLPSECKSQIRTRRR